MVTGCAVRSKYAICSIVRWPSGAVTVHSASPSPRPAKASASWAVAPSRSAANPARCSADSTDAAAAPTPVSSFVNRSTSWVGRLMRPCAIRALPPPSANPYRGATRRGTAPPPRPPAPPGEVQVWPQVGQGGGIQVGAEVFRAAGLAQHRLVVPQARIGIVKVEPVIRQAPEQPEGQLDRAGGRAAQVGEVVDDQDASAG